MPTPHKINVAVVGLGWVATNRHIPVILRQPQLNFYGVVDKRQERIQNLAKKYPWLKTSLSQQGEMPWAEEVQAVIIATDPLNHYSLAKKMLLAGKHVLIEKPLTMTEAESTDLENLSRKLGITCCVVHNFQFARSTLQLQAMLNTAQLGDIQSVEARQLSNPRRRLPIWYEQLPFGLFYDESPHMFYILEAICGQEIQHIRSSVILKSGQNTPLSVMGNYVAGTIPIQLSMNFNASLSEWHVTVMGSKGVAILDIFRDILVTIPNDGLHRAREIVISSGSAIATHLWGFLKSGILLTQGKLFYGADIVWQKFIREVTGKSSAGEISVAHGARIVKLQHEIMNQSQISEL